VSVEGSYSKGEHLCGPNYQDALQSVKGKERVPGLRNNSISHRTGEIDAENLTLRRMRVVLQDRVGKKEKKVGFQTSVGKTRI